METLLERKRNKAMKTLFLTSNYNYRYYFLFIFYCCNLPNVLEVVCFINIKIIKNSFLGGFYNH